MGMFKDQTREYLSHRLSRSIINYKDKPHYVYRVPDGGGTTANIELGPVSKMRRLGDGSASDLFRVSVADKHLSFSPISLGYVNYDGVAYYLMRAPIRRSRQGLSEEGVRIKTAFPSALANVSTSILLTYPLAKCVANRYPTIDEAINILDKHQIATVAVSRTFAIGMLNTTSMELHHKGNRVGTIGSSGPQLNSRYLYLTESLHKEVLHVNK